MNHLEKCLLVLIAIIVLGILINAAPGYCGDGDCIGNENACTCPEDCALSDPVICGNSKTESCNIPPEQCDNGLNNGVPCSAPYGGSCTYCSFSCQNQTVQGGYCGDVIVQPAYEECEGSNGCYLCKLIPQICGDGLVQAPETCDIGADQPNGVCFSNECSRSCACTKNSGGLKITAIKIAPGTTFTAGNALQAFDANVFVNDTNRNTNPNAVFDGNLGIFNTASGAQVAEIPYTVPPFAPTPLGPVFKIDIIASAPTFSSTFKALSPGSYMATVQIKRHSDSKVVAQKDTFFSITSSVNPIAVSETSPLLSVIAAFLVVGIIFGKPVFGRLKLKR